jgi:hypothetical protein
MGMVTDETDALVVPEGTNQSGGVTDVTTANPASDADSEAVYKEQLLRLQKDIDRMRSTYDRNAAERDRQWKAEKAELETRLHQTATKDMDEKDRATYERDLYASRLQEYEQRLEQMEQQRQQEANMRQYADAYQKAFGVKPEDLDLSDPQKFQESAWSAATNRFAELQRRLEELEGKKPTTARTATTDKSVVTTQGNVPRSKLTMADFRTRVAQMRGVPVTAITDDDVWREYEQGRISLDGLL